MMISTKYFPNLSNLNPFINIQTMNEYPKFSLLSFEALADYMPIFEN